MEFVVGQNTSDDSKRVSLQGQILCKSRTSNNNVHYSVQWSGKVTEIIGLTSTNKRVLFKTASFCKPKYHWAFLTTQQCYMRNYVGKCVIIMVFFLKYRFRIIQ